MIFGLDIGYGYIKLAVFDGTGTRYMIVPSFFGKYIPKKSFNESFETIIVNGSPYIIGNNVEGSTRVSAGFVGSNEYLAIIGYCLSRVSVVKKVLILGLPPQAYDGEKISSIKDVLRHADIRLDDGTKIYLPSRIEFVPQGAGIFFAHLSQNGIDDYGKTTVVVDMGYHTMDIVLFSGEKFRASMSKSYPLGVKVLYDTVRDAYIKKYSIFISPDRDEIVERLILHGRIPHIGGEEHTLDVGDILDNFYTGRILKAIRDYVSDAKEHGYMVEKIILGGGGIAYVSGVSGVDIVAEPQFANARGFVEYGKKLI